LISKIKKQTTITLDGKEFKLNYTQGGDLKWLANMTGINAANSNHPCVWCTWCCKSAIDFDKEYSISERSNEASTTSRNILGYKEDPLIDFINFKNCIVDPLHLCLRITDKILAKLIDHLSFLDGNVATDLKCLKNPLMKRLKQFLEYECKISSPFYFCKRLKIIKFRSINKNEREQILKFLLEKKDLLDLFYEYKDDTKLVIFNFVMIEFYKLFMFVKSDHSEYFDAESLKNKLKFWGKQFVKCTDGEKLTPYVHVFIFHVPEFISVYKNINRYSMQALEKLNWVTKSNYFRQTNRKPMEFINQLILKANRTEFYRLEATRTDFHKILS